MSAPLTLPEILAAAASRPLEDAELAALRAALPPPAPPSARERKDARDCAIRAAASLLDVSDAYPAACEMAARWNAYLCSSLWRSHQDHDALPIGTPALTSLLHAATRQNSGRGLAVGQIRNVLLGCRNPVSE